MPSKVATPYDGCFIELVELTNTCLSSHKRGLGKGPAFEKSSIKGRLMRGVSAVTVLKEIFFEFSCSKVRFPFNGSIKNPCAMDCVKTILKKQVVMNVNTKRMDTLLVELLVDG